MTHDFDLIVVGGGPAGSSAAITAAREGQSVLLLERGRMPRHKVCGEFVSAESLDLLRWLIGQSGDALIEKAIRLSESNIFLDGRELRVAVNPPGASVTRYELDFALWNAAIAAGVTTLAETTLREIKSERPFHAATTAGEFSARGLINASGRWSNLHRVQKSRKGFRWLGLKAHCRGEMDPTVDLYFFPGGYCGVQPVRTSEGVPTVNVCALVHPEAVDSVQKLLRCHPLLESRGRSWREIFPALRTFPIVFRQPTPFTGCVLNAGDAANFVDPFVGDGIAIALYSGHLAARNLVPHLREERGLDDSVGSYARDYEASLANVYRRSTIFRNLLRAPRMLRAPFLFACEKSPRLAEQLAKSTRSRANLHHAMATVDEN